MRNRPCCRLCCHRSRQLATPLHAGRCRQRSQAGRLSTLAAVHACNDQPAPCWQNSQALLRVPRDPPSLRYIRRQNFASRSSPACTFMWLRAICCSCRATSGVQRVLQVASQAAQAVGHGHAPLLRRGHNLGHRPLHRVTSCAAAAARTLAALVSCTNASWGQVTTGFAMQLLPPSDTTHCTGWVAVPPLCQGVLRSTADQRPAKWKL